MRPLNDIGVEFSDKERKLLDFLVHDCMRDDEIARELRTTKQVIRNFLRAIHHRTGIHDRVKLARALRPASEKQPVPDAVRLALSPLMWSIAKDIADGRSTAEMAERIGKSLEATKRYRERVFDITGCWSRLELGAWYDAHQTPCEGGICVG